MHIFFILISLFCPYFLLGIPSVERSSESNLMSITYKLQPADADWLVVGAGPAGIAAIGILLDVGVQPERITWVDPEFNVGRMGIYYHNVPANNKFKDFMIFLNSCQTFQACAPSFEKIQQQDPEDHPFLGQMIEVLTVLTTHLRSKVKSVQASMIGLHFDHGLWHVGTNACTTISAQHVILATGSHPKNLEYEQQKIISLDEALDRYKLAQLITPDDVVGVVGGAHSAILILKFLSELPVKHIYNFYRSPITYSVDRGEWILSALACFERTIGLYGIAAQWAHDVLEHNPPANISRIKILVQASV